MIKQQQFEGQHLKDWQRFESLLNDSALTKDNRKGKRKTDKGKITQSPLSAEHQSTQYQASPNQNVMGNQQADNLTNRQLGSYEFVYLYRMICQHYALAKQRHYSPSLVSYLHDLVIAGHRLLYQKQSHIGTRMYDFFAYTFPVQLRRHSGLFWLSCLCFVVPAVLMGWACYVEPDMIYSIMPEDQVLMMEEMYNPANEMVGRDSSRRSDTDLMMFGHYIQNNIGIDFQIYGTGLFAGIGTLLSVLYNGLVIGGVAGHLSGIGYGETFWPFVSGHGSFELTAAVISGAAGLRLAQSLFMPGNYSRIDAFKIAGKQSIILLMGAASMTFIAAFIEAFWSSSSIIPDIVKYVVALVLWIMVIAYLCLAGRNSEANGR